MTSGNQKPGSTPNYPDDTIQYQIDPDPWWIDDGKRNFELGRLVWAFLPHVDQSPYAIKSVGRVQSTVHNVATVEFVPIDVKSTVQYGGLPVAAIPEHSGEIKVLYRAKRRPALVVHPGGPNIDNELRKNKPRRHTEPCILVAPFYGTNKEGLRAGYTEAFQERVRRCEYPQFFWDILPFEYSNTSSLMRLDQLQPVGRNHSTVEVTTFRLSDSALIIMKEFFDWFNTGEVVEKSILHDFKISMFEIPYLCTP